MIEKRGRPPGNIKSTLEHYRKNPAKWIYDTFGIEVWDKQEEIMNTVWNNRYTAVKSCFASGKCLEENEEILLSDGSWVSVKELNNKEFNILSFEEKSGKQQIEKAWATDNGIKPVYKIILEDGTELKRTNNHMLLSTQFSRVKTPQTTRLCPEIPAWKKVEYLEKDKDFLLVPKKHFIEEPKKSYPISDDKLKLLGMLIGDGGTTTTSITFTQKDNELLKEFKQVCNNLNCNVKQLKNSKYGYTILAKYNTNHITKLVKEWNLLGKKSTEKEFPSWIFKLSNKQLAIVLNRYFSCDGWAYTDNNITKKKGYRGEIGITSASKKLIQQTKRALLRFGIPSKIRYKKSKCKNKTFDSWCLQIRKPEDIKTFYEEIGIKGKNNKIKTLISHLSNQQDSYKYKEAATPKGFKWCKIKEIEYLGKKPTINISVENTHTFITEVVEHNSFVAACLAIAFVHLYKDSTV
ncbi:MAG: LAGLIDADG family homing endonuclease, partial [Candidatus Woesearchaeota archaeon]